MFVSTALKLIEGLSYKPGWHFEASDYTKRFQDTIMLKCVFPAYESERGYAYEGYPKYRTDSWAQFPIMVGDINEDTELYRRVLEAIMKLEEHEAREFLRVTSTMWAPFHPHNTDGMKRWGNIAEDFRYGIA